MMEWFPRAIDRPVSAYLEEWNGQDEVHFFMNETLPFEMVDTLYFVQGGKLLVFGSMLIHVERALKKQGGHILLRMEGRIMNVVGSHALDEFGNQCRFVL